MVAFYEAVSPSAVSTDEVKAAGLAFKLTSPPKRRFLFPSGEFRVTFSRLVGAGEDSSFRGLKFVVFPFVDGPIY